MEDNNKIDLFPYKCIPNGNKEIPNVSNYNSHNIALFSGSINYIDEDEMTENIFQTKRNDLRRKGKYAENVTVSAFEIAKKRIPLKNGHGDKNGIVVLDKHTFLNLEICNWSYSTCKLIYNKPTVHANRIHDRFYEEKQVNKTKELIDFYKGIGKLEEPIKVLNYLIISYPINPTSIQKLLDEDINVLVIGRDILVHQDHILQDSCYWKDKILSFKRIIPQFKDRIVLYVPIEMKYIDWYQDLVPRIVGHIVVYY